MKKLVSYCYLENLTKRLKIKAEKLLLEKLKKKKSFNMSVIKFELKKEHVLLLKNLRWGLTQNKFIVSTENITEDPAPFGADTVYEGVDLILNGKPEGFDPLNNDGMGTYTDEQISEWDKLISELPTALDIILYNGNFELGTYKTRYHLRDWKKITTK